MNFSFQDIRLKFEINPYTYTHTWRQIFISKVTVYTTWCPAKLPFPEISTFLFHNHNLPGKLPVYALQDFWKSLLAHYVLSWGLQKGEDSLTKPCQGNVVPPASQRSGCNFSSSWPVKDRALPGFISQAERKSIP